MLKTKEFTTDNLVKDREYGIVTVVEVHEGALILHHPSIQKTFTRRTMDLEGIKLLDIWMLKEISGLRNEHTNFGWQKSREFLVKGGEPISHYYSNRYILDKDGLWLRYDKVFLCGVDYVHQLQNILYYLGGEEIHLYNHGRKVNV